MLVYSEFRKSKFYPFKSDLRILWTGASGFLVLLVLWYFQYFWYSGFLVVLVLCKKQGFTFREIQPLKICAEDAKVILEEGHTFLDGFGAEIPLQQKALIFMYDNSDVFHSCERCFLQLGSDTMLMVKPLLYFFSLHQITIS